MIILHENILYCTTHYSFSGGNGMVKQPSIKCAHPSIFQVRGINEKLRAGKSRILYFTYFVLETSSSALIFVVVPLHTFASSSVTNANTVKTYQDKMYKGPEDTPHSKGMKHTNQPTTPHTLLIITH